MAAGAIIMLSAANKAKACVDCVSEPLTTTESIVLVSCMICLGIIILWIGRK